MSDSKVGGSQVASSHIRLHRRSLDTLIHTWGIEGLRFGKVVPANPGHSKLHKLGGRSPTVPFLTGSIRNYNRGRTCLLHRRPNPQTRSIPSLPQSWRRGQMRHTQSPMSAALCRTAGTRDNGSWPLEHSYGTPFNHAESYSGLPTCHELTRRGTDNFRGFCDPTVTPGLHSPYPLTNQGLFGSLRP